MAEPLPAVLRLEHLLGRPLAVIDQVHHIMPVDLLGCPVQVLGARDDEVTTRRWIRHRSEGLMVSLTSLWQALLLPLALSVLYQTPVWLINFAISREA